MDQQRTGEISGAANVECQYIMDHFSQMYKCIENSDLSLQKDSENTIDGTSETQGSFKIMEIK